MSDSFDNIIL